MNRIEEICQNYLGMKPEDKFCKNWNEMQKKMTNEISEFIKEEILSALDPYFYDTVKPTLRKVVENVFKLSDDSLPKDDKKIEEKRNWTEDSAHENGNYMNKCHVCDNMFIGHKRRVVCKDCFDQPVSYINDKNEPARNTPKMVSYLETMIFTQLTQEQQRELINKFITVSNEKK